MQGSFEKVLKKYEQKQKYNALPKILSSFKHKTGKRIKAMLPQLR